MMLGIDFWDWIFLIAAGIAVMDILLFILTVTVVWYVLENRLNR